jgi:hypothetical protein
MNHSFKIMFFSILVLFGCAPIKYLQPNSDVLPINLNSQKAIVVVQVSFGEEQSPVLFLTKRVSDPINYDAVTVVDTVEFANYEGAVIPTYSSKSPYGIHAFYLEPGDYVIMRCVYGRPETEWCIPGVSKNNGQPVGLAIFTAKAGEVINVGNFNISRSRDVKVIDNNVQVLEYIRSNHPNLINKIEYQPMTFTKW